MALGSPILGLRCAKKCPRVPVWVKLFGQCPNRPCNFFSGASLSQWTLFIEQCWNQSCSLILFSSVFSCVSTRPSHRRTYSDLDVWDVAHRMFWRRLIGIVAAVALFVNRGIRMLSAILPRSVHIIGLWCPAIMGHIDTLPIVSLHMNWVNSTISWIWKSRGRSTILCHLTFTF